jgi:hypothetical protein
MRQYGLNSGSSALLKANIMYVWNTGKDQYAYTV